MIESVEINGFRRKKSKIINFKKDISIFIGKNGTGKTTLLNIIFHTLNCDLEVITRLPFRSLTLNLEPIEEEIKAKDKIVRKISVEKSRETTKITYWFGVRKRVEIIYTPSINHIFDEYSFSVYPTKKNQKEDDDEYEFMKVDRTIDQLIKNNHEELSFIKSLSESVMYFPTYRRLDQDLPEVIENSNHREFNENVKEYFNSNPHDGRILGVNQHDIENLLELYSESLRVFSSSELNLVLKNFVEQTIKTTTYAKKALSKREQNTDTDGIYETAPDTLIDLSKKLNLTIDEEQIKEHYKAQLEFKKSARNNNINIDIEFNLKSKGTKSTEIDSKDGNIDQKDSSDTKKEKSISISEEVLKRIFLSKVTETTPDERLVFNLLEIYKSYLAKEEMHLNKFYLLESILSAFFGEKIKLVMNKKNYSIEFNVPFTILSTGEKQLIVLITYIVLGNAQNTPYKQLIIIDEPEISLHIDWQYDLLSQLLKIEKTNYLIATHSPYIARVEYSSNVIKIEEDKEYV